MKCALYVLSCWWSYKAGRPGPSPTRGINSWVVWNPESPAPQLQAHPRHPGSALLYVQWHWDSRVRNLIANVLRNVAWSVTLLMARPAPKWMECYLPVQTKEGRAGSGLRIGDLLWASRLWFGGSSLSLWSWACSSAKWTGDEMSFPTFMIIWSLALQSWGNWGLVSGRGSSPSRGNLPLEQRTEWQLLFGSPFFRAANRERLE